MSNIDNIIEKLKTDAEATSTKIIEDAKTKAEEDYNIAIENAKKTSQEIIEKATNIGPEEKDRVIQRAKLEARDIVLEAEEEIIEKVIEKANDKLKNLSTDDYIKYLQTKLKSMELGKDDLLIVPKKYREAVIKEELAIKLSEENIESGFGILRGNILYNNAFEKVLESLREDLEEEISNKLFDRR